MSIGMGLPMERVRMICMEKMVLPVGPAPAVERDDDEGEMEIDEK
jgi:splicing factor 3B subunit 5